MAGHDLEPKLFKPKFMAWIAGPTYDLGEKEFRPIWDDLIIKLKLGDHKRVKKAYNKRTGEMFIEMPWGARVEVRSAQHPDKLVGEGLDHVIMSEAAKHNVETWERFIRPALSDRRGTADFPTTPEGHNWLYDLFLVGKNSRIPEYESWCFPSWENPIVYPGGREDDEIKLIERTTTPEWFMQEIGADFASFVGKIYGEWDDSLHVRSHTWNPAWPNYIGFDWGFTNPLAAIEFQIDPFDNIYVWREYYKQSTALLDILTDLKNRVEPPGYHINCCFGDAADPGATMTVATRFAPCVSDPESKKMAWREGVDLIKLHLKEYQIGEADEYGTPLCKPKLTVDPSCTELIHEFNNYRAKEGTAGRNAQEVADKMDDHGLDALRYGLLHIYKLGAHHHLSEVASDNELATVGAGLGEHGGTYFNMKQEW
jgi:hypothetical protein